MPVHFRPQYEDNEDLRLQILERFFKDIRKRLSN
jgi:hypothetical protein